MKSYTIDLTTSADGKWLWRLYTEGGGHLLNNGWADTIETAADDAKRQMLVRHRQGDE